MSRPTTRIVTPARQAREAAGLTLEQVARRVSPRPSPPARYVRNAAQRLARIEKHGGYVVGAGDVLLGKLARLYGCSFETVAYSPNYHAGIETGGKDNAAGKNQAGRGG